MTYLVKPCGTFGAKAARFLIWANALDHALDLIEKGYARAMIGTEQKYLDTPAYEPLGYVTREEGVLRWVAYAGPPNNPPARNVVLDQVRGYRNALMPCS